MIIPCTCVNAADIRMTVCTHQSELTGEMQEVRISTTHLPYPLCGVLLSYQQALKATSRDSLTLATLNEQKPVTIEINDITRFEVLPTRLMTPAHAYQQMKEMERIVGL